MGEIASSICNFYLNVPAGKLVSAGTSIHPCDAHTDIAVCWEIEKLRNDLVTSTFSHFCLVWCSVDLVQCCSSCMNMYHDFLFVSGCAVEANLRVFVLFLLLSLVQNG